MATTQTSTKEEAAIRNVVDDWAEALRSKDADRLTSHYVPNVVMFTLAPPLQITGSSGDGLQQWFDTWRGGIGYEIRDLDITASDDLAFARSLNRLSGTKTDGEQQDVWFRETLCFQKVSGDWKIAHEHSSVPFYMDGSARAALDLKP